MVARLCCSKRLDHPELCTVCAQVRQAKREGYEVVAIRRGKPVVRKARYIPFFLLPQAF